MKKEVLRKIEKEKAGKTAVFLIVNLVVAIIAFSFLIGLYDAEIVRASLAKGYYLNKGTNQYFYSDGKEGVQVFTGGKWIKSAFTPEDRKSVV